MSWTTRTSQTRAAVIALSALALGVAALTAATPASARAEAGPGTRPAGPSTSAATTSAAEVQSGLKVVVNENGHISLSTDAAASGAGAEATIVKPAGATVRKAYVAVASTGFAGQLTQPVTVNGVDIALANEVPTGIGSDNYFMEATDAVKADIDAAPAGNVSIPIIENPDYATDGVILAVVFDDPSVVENQTVTLLYGALAPSGDQYAVQLERPIDKSAAGLKLEMSLGISFGAQAQGAQQVSQIDINGQRLTSAAGGEDDGVTANGDLITVGGTGDSIDNPADPFAAATTDPRSDDELYDLRPFVANGDTSITVATLNPTNDDNIFFAAFTANPPATLIDTSGDPTAVTVAATAPSPSYTYGDAIPATFTPTYAGYQDGQSPDLAPTCTSTATTGSPVGTYPITCSGGDATVTGDTSHTYSFSYVDGTLTITQAPVVVTADNQTKVYGGADPTFTSTPIGLVGNDGLTAPATCSVQGAHSDVGTYPITCTGADAGANYSVGYQAGTLTVTAKPITVTADSFSIVYGQDAPTFTSTTAGLEPGDALTTPATCGVTGPHTKAGSYPITCTGASAGNNYTISYLPGTYTVATKAGVVTADPQSVVYGSGDPTFTYTVSGLQPGDSLATEPTCTVAGAHSDVGDYPITCSGGDGGSDYTLTYVAGTLSVTQAPVVITANNQTKPYGSADPAFTSTTSGLLGDDTLATPASCTVSGAHAAPGSYPITCDGADAGDNYSITYTDGTLTVRPPACSDGRDNDRNGVADYPEDLGCAGPLDTTESASIACPSTGRVASPRGGLLKGGRFADKLTGRWGRDVLWGLGGNDCLFGNANRDRLLGGYGGDLLAGGSGPDRLLGSFGNDVLYGGSGSDTLVGGAGNDLMNGGPASDVVLGGYGNDRIVSDGGIRDVIDCGPGKDIALVDRYDVVRNCETKVIRRTGRVLY